MKKLAILTAFILLLTACVPTAQTGSDNCTLYYFETEDSESLVGIEQKIDTSEVGIVNTVFSMLKTAEAKEHTPVIPRDIRLIASSITDKVCSLTLSEGYLEASAATRVAINACLTKTLCSLPEIERVVIACGEVSSEFSAADFITDAPNTDYSVYTVNLYYANSNNDGLEADRHTFTLTPDTTLEYTVVSRLLASPSSASLNRAIPEGTKLNSVYVDEGVCYIDLSAEFVDNVVHKPINEALALHSIVNTVTELPMINSVKLLIDGSPSHGLIYYNITGPLTNKTDIFE